MTGLAPLLRHHWRQHRLPLVPMAAAVLVFEFLLTRIAPAADEMGWLGNLLAAFPPALRALIGGEIAISSRGFLTIGYAHPFLLLILSVWAVRVPSAALAGEIGRGTIDLLATRPVRRSTQVAAGFIALTSGAMLLSSAAWCGTAAGLATRPLGVTAWPFAPAAMMLCLLFVTWGSVGLFVSALRHDAGSAIAWTFGLMAVSFVLEYLARLWAPIASLRPLSLFAYYRPQVIVAGGPLAPDLVPLAVVLAAVLAAAFVWFSRRDL